MRELSQKVSRAAATGAAADPVPAPDGSGDAAATARGRILEAACDLIAAEGLDGVRIARIATAAGISTSLIHYHFDTRERLLEEAIDHSFDRAAEVFQSADDDREEAAAGGSSARLLADRIDQCLPLPGVLERDWLLWWELDLHAVRTPELRPVAARLYRRYHEFLAGPIAAGVQSGEFGPCDPSEVADIAIALVDGHGGRALIGDPEMPVTRVRRLIGATLGRELGLAEPRLPFRRLPRAPEAGA
jgi:AcrR family transcriptional regulator